VSVINLLYSASPCTQQLAPSVTMTCWGTHSLHIDNAFIFYPGYFYFGKKPTDLIGLIYK